MTKHSEVFVAFDTSKLRNAVAIAEAGRAGEVRFLGEIENTAEATTKLALLWQIYSCRRLLQIHFSAMRASLRG